MSSIMCVSLCPDLEEVDTVSATASLPGFFLQKGHKLLQKTKTCPL